MNAIAEQILNIEKGFWEQGTPEFFQKHFSENGAAIFEPMGVINKADSIEMASDAKPFQDVTMQDIYTQQLTPDVIAISYHGEGRRDGDKEPYQGRLTSIYVKKDDEWQLALTVHQPWKSGMTAEA